MTKTYQVLRDGKIIHTTKPGEDPGVWLHKTQPHSIEWATKYEGYQIVEVKS